ncbi:MAG: hypothetical protein DRP08_06615 [Candidatus Aenigmatarchaeota archaeon]|nr:MAG: hypothetical protein DRP08_06615 [Candidatus Aenigmarchaeota archaeon]
METNDLKQFMTFRSRGEIRMPISVIKVNDDFILAIYKGRKGPADILIRYRQKLKNSNWSNIRTPKHIHWTVDILIKMFQEEHLTKQFIDELMKIWEKEIQPMTQNERDSLELTELLNYDRETLERFRELSKYGEYNVKFLLLLAKLLMLQEKTNYPEGQLFQTLLKKLKEGEDIFSILQTATLGRLR